MRLKTIFVPFALALGLFALLEGGCRIAGRLRRGVWPETRAESYARFSTTIASAYRRHPFLLVAGRPGAVVEVPGHVVHLNSRGMRGPDVSTPKRPGVFRIVCEGGSTTFDLLAPDDGHTWPSRLGDFLKPRDVDVVNAGFSGWTTAENLISLELRDVDLAPDLVVVLSGWNDLQPAGHVPFTPDYSLGHGDVLPRALGLEKASVPLAAHSLFVESLLDAFHVSEPAAGTRYAPSWRWKGPRLDAIPDDAVSAYRRNLESTIGVARVHGARTLLLAQEVRIRHGHEASDLEWLGSWVPGLTHEGYVRGLERFNDAARSVADENGELFFHPFTTSAFSDDDYADPVHFSAKGSERFARILADWIGARLDELRPGAATSVRPAIQG
jgi:lysophospholipase L1-like esterase